MRRKLTDWFAILNPSCWGRVGSYSKPWDEELNRLLDLHHFKAKDKYVASLGDAEIWIGNHPYSSFTPFNHSHLTDFVLPRRVTVHRAMRKLKIDMDIERVLSGLRRCDVSHVLPKSGRSFG